MVKQFLFPILVFISFSDISLEVMAKIQVFQRKNRKVPFRSLIGRLTGCYLDNEESRQGWFLYVPCLKELRKIMLLIIEFFHKGRGILHPHPKIYNIFVDSWVHKYSQFFICKIFPYNKHICIWNIWLITVGYRLYQWIFSSQLISKWFQYHMTQK